MLPNFTFIGERMWNGLRPQSHENWEFWKYFSTRMGKFLARFLQQISGFMFVLIKLFNSVAFSGYCNKTSERLRFISISAEGTAQFCNLPLCIAKIFAQVSIFQIVIKWRHNLCATANITSAITGSIARSANLPVFSLLRGRF